jgi:hypothetical protein
LVGHGYGRDLLVGYWYRLCRRLLYRAKQARILAFSFCEKGSESRRLLLGRLGVRRPIGRGPVSVKATHSANSRSTGHD